MLCSGGKRRVAPFCSPYALNCDLFDVALYVSPEGSNMIRASKLLFYLIAAWCVVIGSFNQTISTVDDLPWVAASLAGSDVDAFNPILAVWAHWIGMFLITSGAALALLLSRLPVSLSSLAVASVLAVGTVGAQSYSVLALGASGPISYVLYLTPMVAIVASALGFAGLRSESDGV